MNQFLTKAAEIFGFSTERVEKLTAEEQTKLAGYGETAAQLEKERDDANQAKADAEAKIDSINLSMTDANAKIESLEAAAQDHVTQIESLNGTITEKDAKIAELEATISSLPGAADTTVTAGEEPMPTRTIADDKPKYWSSADQELADFQAKFKKKTTK